MKLNASQFSRFMRKVRVCASGCWEWTAHVQKDGYGSFALRKNGRSTITGLAHRVSYEHWLGPIPEGLQLDHLCRNRRCVNPKHLEPVTGKINVRRGDTGKHHREKTHCPAGHEYTPENTRSRRHPQGHMSRTCIACDREQDKLRKRRYRAEGRVKTRAKRRTA